MDSLTQATLGACVGVTLMGRKIGPRRAALTGAVLGTLPDLDVFLAPDDPIDAFIKHRGWSHSLLVHAALTPLIGEGLRHFFALLKDNRILTYVVTYLCLSTHALLDAITVYGTQLFWPVWPEPLSVGSIFIIDPLYTLPLLVMTLWASLTTTWTTHYQKALYTALIASTFYLGWSMAAQKWVTNQAQILLADHGIKPEKLLAIPTPFNTFHWRVIGIDGERSFNLYTTVFGDPEAASLYVYNRNLNMESCINGDPRVSRIAKFSDGFYRIMVNDGEFTVADIRMGLTPYYAFRFALGRLEDGAVTPTQTRRLDGLGDVHTDLEWIFKNIRGIPTGRLAEASARLDFDQYPNATPIPSSSVRC